MIGRAWFYRRGSAKALLMMGHLSTYRVLGTMLTSDSQCISSFHIFAFSPGFCLGSLGNIMAWQKERKYQLLLYLMEVMTSTLRFPIWKVGG